MLPSELTDAADKRKTEYLVGRICAREAVKRITGHASAPSLGADRAPCWPEGITGSVTHSHGRAAAIGASNQHYLSLGLDAEVVLSDSRATKLVQKILTSSERQRFQLDLAQRPGHLTTLAFSVKESLFKALYPLTRKRFYFEDAELLEWNEPGLATVRLLTDLSGDWRAGQQLTACVSLEGGRLLSLVPVTATGTR
ncbi:MAG: 4'-phosphopantetheinyl transferase superfamily protein [Marinobacter sp.]|uniref:4'-phosphopantetheinyl transferase n=1 Tax=Marinobacter sp. TaxID=50741 RepID=UPI0034A099A5